MTNANADDYAAARQNVFFTANNQTPADGNLTGQCVTLLKWFFQDMCTGFPVPFMARGNAKDVGHTLVSQGLAVEVNWAERRRGDVICYEFGLYGHIASQLSGGRVFEQNVNWSGVASKIVDGERVYASRIGSENEAWRVGKNAHVYRLNSYNEGGDTMDLANRGDVQNVYFALLHREPSEADIQWNIDHKITFKQLFYNIKDSPEFIVTNFINDGDIANLKNQGIDASGTKDLFWKYGSYKMKPVAGGSLPPGTYLKINKDDVKEV